jgi:excisionase family DNA binding protein
METQASPPLLGAWNARNLLTVLEVAEWARVHPKTVYCWIREGRLEAIQFGPRTFHVPEDAIAQFLRIAGNKSHYPAQERMEGGQHDRPTSELLADGP